MDIQAAKKLCDAATKGDWVNVRGIDGAIVCDINGEAWDITDDAEFIARARSDLPAALEALEEARGKLKVIRHAALTNNLAVLDAFAGESEEQSVADRWAEEDRQQLIHIADLERQLAESQRTQESDGVLVERLRADRDRYKALAERRGSVLERLTIPISLALNAVTKRREVVIAEEIFREHFEAPVRAALAATPEGVSL